MDPLVDLVSEFLFLHLSFSLLQSEDVIDQTLGLFLELASGFVCLLNIFKF